MSRARLPAGASHGNNRSQIEILSHFLQLAGRPQIVKRQLEQAAGDHAMRLVLPRPRPVEARVGRIHRLLIEIAGVVIHQATRVCHQICQLLGQGGAAVSRLCPGTANCAQFEEKLWRQSDCGIPQPGQMIARDIHVLERQRRIGIQCPLHTGCELPGIRGIRCERRLRAIDRWRDSWYGA